jgi:hypothetical protein
MGRMGRCKPIFIDQLQLSTNADKLSDMDITTKLMAYTLINLCKFCGT